MVDIGMDWIFKKITLYKHKCLYKINKSYEKVGTLNDEIF